MEARRIRRPIGQDFNSLVNRKAGIQNRRTENQETRGQQVKKPEHQDARTSGGQNTRIPEHQEACTFYSMYKDSTHPALY